MSKKTKKFIISIDGELLECDSLIELKGGVTDEEWLKITSGTVKYMCYSKMLRDMAMPLLQEEWNKDDERLLKGLRRTIEYMRRLDPVRISQFNIKEICDQYATIMARGVNDIRELMKNATGRGIAGAGGTITVGGL